MTAESAKTTTETSRRCPRVLVVDDEPLNVDLLMRRLKKAGYEPTGAESTAQAFAKIAEQVPEIVLLDINMPGISGIEALVRLRESDETHALPIIMVSALSESERIVEALHKGANDYVTKPVDMPVLLARIETQLKLASTVRQLEVQTQLLQQMAAYDELTGVYNRRSMTDAMNAQHSLCVRMNRPFSVIMLDLDHFKKINDTLGHGCGDQALREFAHRILASVRSMDIVCRYGGEEFFVILPETSIAMAALVAERFREEVAAAPFMLSGQAIPITVSVGVSGIAPGEKMTAEQLREEADQALYRAKREGRNRVCVAERIAASLNPPT